MDFFISTAHAQQAAAPQGGAMFNLLFIGGMFVLFYLILWRPQAKRAKEHRELVGNLGKGDEVLTSGGILGKVTKVTDDYIAVEVADGVELNLQKSAVAAALPKGTIKSIG
ncbi:MAG: preprotein translocase subunit YajC [Pseudomonadota bacterium]|uniref:preprotein translocase subunit YajC n=1 Tax=Pseudohongiella sp. O18 TaxID=2904248 RepID=UPI000C384BDE|nr:preprotein translocase subunit YajC [Pseudohongiella sp. O18]MAY54344.1 preprotein translocase subunit YajC [Gammaproteobacteria bacterium]MBJ55988.1 preprotein translocase subunit YajC [Gammaproteobacteria bacterium]MEC8858905.1 preprotein translocase subunit YajC [Pseudomonadota bacterium]HBN15423.1 preprotein translocase subunit YajC [Pseudohongiella sp.]|tara:strand:- start:102 stop:434 length:333 start_codon:yes stop_codon:yes gene_type:complete